MSIRGLKNVNFDIYARVSLATKACRRRKAAVISASRPVVHRNERMIGRRGLEKASSRLLLRNVLILSGSISYAAILFLAGTSRRNNAEAAAFARPFFGAITQCERSSTSLSFSVARNEECKNVRTRKTAADLYFEQHKKLPKPKMMHATLEPVPKSTSQKNILVIGDVHGCFEELKLLHQKALKENGGVPFRYVILVGDLCQKGPDSAQVRGKKDCIKCIIMLHRTYSSHSLLCRWSDMFVNNQTG